MYNLIMRLHQDKELQRRITRDGAQPLVGPPIPRGRKPDPLKAQPHQLSPKPRARRHTPIADALAAWRAYDARRHAKRETPVAGGLQSLGDRQLLKRLSGLHGDVPGTSGAARNHLWDEALELRGELQRRYPPIAAPLKPKPT
jgi:hypothetical protein